MKIFVTMICFVALFNLSTLRFAQAGEARKQPLQIQEMVELTKKQDNDHQGLRDTEAGIANGYGLLTILLAVGVGYLVYDQIKDDDDDDDDD